MVMFSIASALAPNGDNTNVALGVLTACRFGLGFGVGGCYPLSAVKSAEECRGTTVADKNFDVGMVRWCRVSNFFFFSYLHYGHPHFGY